MSTPVLHISKYWQPSKLNKLTTNSTLFLNFMDKKLVFCFVLRMKVHIQRQWILRFIGTKICWSFTNKGFGQKLTSQCINVYFGLFPVDSNRKISGLTALPVHYSSIFCHYSWITYLITGRALILSVYRSPRSVLSAAMSKQLPTRDYLQICYRQDSSQT